MLHRYLPPGVTWGDLLEFGLVCVVLAGVVLFLDAVLQATRGRSLLDIGYANRRKVIIIPGWCLASGVVGVLAAFLQIVQMTFLAAVTIAIGWPLVFAKIVELGSAPPVQQPTAETKEK